MILNRNQKASLHNMSSMLKAICLYKKLTIFQLNTFHYEPTLELNTYQSKLMNCNLVFSNKIRTFLFLMLVTKCSSSVTYIVKYLLLNYLKILFLLLKFLASINNLRILICYMNQWTIPCLLDIMLSWNFYLANII